MSAEAMEAARRIMSVDYGMVDEDDARKVARALLSREAERTLIQQRHPSRPSRGASMSMSTMNLLRTIETLREWRDELRPPQNLLDEVLEAASETFAFRLFVDADSHEGGDAKIDDDTE